SVVAVSLKKNTKLRRMKDRYVFGEFSRSFAQDGRLLYLTSKSIVRNGKIHKGHIAEVRYPLDATSLGFFLLALGEDGNGDIYLLGNTTAAPAGSTGTLVRISEP